MINNSEPNQKIYLKDYQPPHFQILSTELKFEIFDTYVQVTQWSQYEMAELKPVNLNGVNLEILSFEIDNNKMEATHYSIDSKNETLHFLPDKKSFSLKVVTKMDPYNNKSLEGLYKSNNYLVTQCEAQGFRKITYFPDRPDVMTTFLVTLIADKNKYPTLLANGDLIKTESLENHRHSVTWKDPWKKPCYLFALFAGDVGSIKDSYLTLSGKKVSLEIYCDHGKESRCTHAMASLKKAMKWDEEVFQREYDLAQYLIVAIDDFNAGAMENKGLNIFNSRLIFADTQTATDSDFFNIESVVAHEYFHNWTGNRITLRDWFQLSLKEGLTVFRDQEFSADMTEKGVQRINDVNTLKEKQFPEDAGPNAHPVRPESCYSVDNFFTATIYEKGAEVIRMMKNILGRQQFRNAMNNYFSKYDGQAITTDDFRKVILDESGFNSEIFKNWYEISGTPEIYVQESFDPISKQFTFKIIQKNHVFHLPIFIEFFDNQGKKITPITSHIITNSDGDNFINLCQKEWTLSHSGFSEKPIISFLRNFSSPIKYHWERTIPDLFTLAKFDDDTFNRREAFTQIYLYLYKTLFKKLYFDASGTIENALHSDLSLEKYLDQFTDLIKSTIEDNSIANVIKSKLLLFPTDQILLQNVLTLDPFLLEKVDSYIKQKTAIKCFGVIEREIQKLNAELKSLNSGYTYESAAKRELLNNLFQLMTYCQDKKRLSSALTLLKIENNFNQELSYFKFSLDLEEVDKKPIVINEFYEKWKKEPLVLQKWMMIIADSHFEDTYNLIKDIYNSPRFNKQNPNQVYSLLRTFGLNIISFFKTESCWDFYLEAIQEIDSFNPQVAARLASCFQSSNLLPEDKKKVLYSKINTFVQKNKLSKNTFELLSKYSL